MNDLLRVSNAALITDKALELCERYKLPEIALGDLNSDHSLPTLDYLKAAGWKLAKTDAAETTSASSYNNDPVRGADGKNHGTKTTDDHTKSIDHIVFRGAIKPMKFAIVDAQYALDISDHSPI